MMLFIASYPDNVTDREGMMRRIAVIDKIFENEERVYVKIAYGKIDEYTLKGKNISDKLTIFELNLNYDFHYRKFRDLILKSSVVYAHSVDNARFLLPYYQTGKIITDMHGLYPEEEAFNGRIKSAEFYNNVEDVVLHQSLCIINVSETMAMHFKSKYPDIRTPMITIPILDSSMTKQFNSLIRNNESKGKWNVIYSGGNQKWQNIPLILDAISKTKDKFHFTILTRDIDDLTTESHNYQISQFIEIKSVSKEEISDYYNNSDFGFVLRDDNIINKVACPTKLTEYLSFGIIPIVKSPDIGDFLKLGYSYLSLEDFINGSIPSLEELKKMRNNNFNILKTLLENVEKSVKELITIINEIRPFDTNNVLFLTPVEIVSIFGNNQLYLDLGTGFNEKDSIINNQNILEFNGTVEFDISGFNNIKQLRFDPINERSVLKINEINVLTEQGDMVEISNYSSNAVYHENNLLFFSTNDPQIFLDVSNIGNPAKVLIGYEFTVKGNESLNYIIEKKEKLILKQKEDIWNKDKVIKTQELEILNKERVLQEIYHSKLWKILTFIRNIYYLFFPIFSIRRKVLVQIVRLLVVDIIRLKDKSPYNIWIKKNEPKIIELIRQKQSRFNISPRISIIVPVFNTPKAFLIDMIKSVLNQTYKNWELCIADASDNKDGINKILKEFMKKDRRIKVKFLDQNNGIAVNTNEAISLSTGNYICLLDHDDTLAPFSLYEIVKVINDLPDTDFIYSDEDKISENSETRFCPHFKPDFSPDLLKSYNYICHLSVFKRTLGEKLGWFRIGYDGSQDYDLILRASKIADRIVHIPKILYHWRVSENSMSGEIKLKTYAFDSSKLALKDDLKRNNISGTVQDGMYLDSYRVSYHIEKKPVVSIIIPNHNHADDLKNCIDSILLKSTYKNIEIIIVENNSDQESVFELYEQYKMFKNIKIINWDKPFNYSSVNNYAINYSSGEYILLLNNDTVVISENWLENMIEHLQRKEVGAVGAKLYYPDDTIQHAGIIIGIRGLPVHSHLNFQKDNCGYMGRLMVVQNLSAVTAACMMVKKELFLEVGGFDEDYTLAYGDVDFCLKIRQKGYLIVWTPYTELYHYESKTRGYEDTPEKQKRFQSEIALFKQKWCDWLKKGDPYYNPNLTLSKSDFSLNIEI